MIEIDGPPLAWFEDSDGTKHIYKTYALQSKFHGDLVQAYAKWYNENVCQEDMLVWRTRPQWPEEDGWYRLFYRVVVVHINPDWHWTLPEKAEGAEAAKIVHLNT